MVDRGQGDPQRAEQIKRYEDTAHALLSEPGVYRKSFRAKSPRSAGEAATETPEVEP